MSVKVAKVVQQVGLANDEGLSFHTDALFREAKTSFFLSQKQVRDRDGVTTGPARVYVVVEQDFIEGEKP